MHYISGRASPLVVVLGGRVLDELPRLVDAGSEAKAVSVFCCPARESGMRAYAAMTSSGRGPFSKSLRFCVDARPRIRRWRSNPNIWRRVRTWSMWFDDEAPTMIASSFSRLRTEWCESHRSEISARVSWCFSATFQTTKRK